MNSSCTQCQTIFRVDPAKVPKQGVRARCSVCSGIFWVRLDAALLGASLPQPTPARSPGLPPQSEALPPPFRQAPAAAAPLAPPAPVFARAVAPPVAAPPPYRPGSPPAPAVSPPMGSPVGASALGARPAAPALSTGSAALLTPATDRPRRPTNPFLSQDPAARARRLARALVSDIVVYHPAKRRDGLRDGSLKILFEEEIRKSWEEYVEQVGREVAEASTFFTDALNEILADGQPVFP